MTQNNGSSAIKHGTPVLCATSSFIFGKSAPPPAMIIPLFIMSAESSGGVSDKTCFAACTISASTSEIASHTSLLEILILRGKPKIKSRPWISINFGSFCGNAVPTFIFISSADCVPIAKLYFFLMYSAIAASILSPATRTECAVTIPPSEMTATSEVPPPMSIIMWPEVELIGMPAPMAAKIGSLATYAWRAPADKAASITALRSVLVIPAGIEIINSGLKNLKLGVVLAIKWRIIAWVTL